MIDIRDATVSDIPTIQEIAENTWPAVYSSIISQDQLTYMLRLIYSNEALKKSIESSDQQFIILYENNKAQGFASFGPRRKDPFVCKLNKLYVLPENQGKGFGRQLINRVKAIIQAKDIHTLDLNVNRFNPAKSFYEKVGFKIIYEEDVPIGPYWMNDYVMRMEF